MRQLVGVKKMCKAGIVFEKMAGIKIPIRAAVDIGELAGAGLLLNARISKNIKSLWYDTPKLRPYLEKALKEKKNIYVKNTNPKVKSNIKDAFTDSKDRAFADRFVTRHELTHSIRADKGKLSSKYYRFLPANIIEESAANAAAIRRPKGISKTRRIIMGTIAGTAQALYRNPIQAVAGLGISGGAAVLLIKGKKKK